MTVRTFTGMYLLVGSLWAALSACSSKEGDALPDVAPPPKEDVVAGSGGMVAFIPEKTEPDPVITVPIAGATGSGGTQGANTGTGGAEAAAGRTVTENCASSKATAMDNTKVRPADIVFAIDSSSSMDEEISFVQMYMNDFSKQIIESGIDVHVILIASPTMTTRPGGGGMMGGGLGMGNLGVCIGAPLGSGACPADENLPTYVHVPTKVGSYDALTLLVDTYPEWKEYLRPDATKSFVVVTDDDAQCSPDSQFCDPPRIDSAALFDEAIREADPMMFAEYTFNGVFSFTECADAAAVGTIYKELVANTKGVSGDLCLQDFQPVFDRLAQQIITNAGSTISCEWELPPAPVGQSFSGELVEVQRTTAAGTSPLARVASAADCTAGGWHLDSALNPTQIVACPNTCMEMQNQSGGKIDITFACEALGNCIATGTATVSSSTPGACDWEIPKPPQGQTIEYASVNVRYTSPSGFAANLGNVASSADCGAVQQGWYYDDPAKPKRIFSCPQTCTEIQAGGATAKVEVLFGCETVPAIVK